MIPFRGEYTRAQYSRGLRLAMYPTGRALALRLLAAVLYLGLLGILVVDYFQGETRYTHRVGRVAISLVILGSWAALPYYRAWRAFRESWRGGRRRLTLSGTVDNEGISSDANTAGTVDRWDSFHLAHVRDDLVVLVGSDGLATILPQDFFESENDWRAFRQMVEFNVVRPR